MDNRQRLGDHRDGVLRVEVAYVYSSGFSTFAGRRLFGGGLGFSGVIRECRLMGGMPGD